MKLAFCDKVPSSMEKERIRKMKKICLKKRKEEKKSKMKTKTNHQKDY